MDKIIVQTVVNIAAGIRLIILILLSKGCKVTDIHCSEKTVMNHYSYYRGGRKIL